MKIKSLCISEHLSHTIPQEPATYLLVESGRIVYAGATKNLLTRIYKHMSRGLIPKSSDRQTWMIYFWSGIKDEGLEAVYIRRLRPIHNKSGNKALIFHDYSDWIEEACECYFLRKAAFVVANLDPLTSTTKLIWQQSLIIEKDLIWLAEVFPWRDTDLMRWQRAINQMQGLITRKAQPADLIAVARGAIAQPPQIPPLEETPKPVRGTAIPKEAISSSILG